MYHYYVNSTKLNGVDKFVIYTVSVEFVQQTNSLNC